MNDLELSHLIDRELIWLASMPSARCGSYLWILGGSGVAPWRGLIILDSEYRGWTDRLTETLAMVAHELTHLLQRQFNQPHYWPSGGLHPGFGRRWIGDSTNYMEVISYLVGWTVEYDFTAAQDWIP